MIEPRGDEELKSGERLHVDVVTAPDAESLAHIAGLLRHKGPEWQFHIEAALTGRTDLLETRFYVGSIGGVPAGNVMTVESRGVGILGHVFTAPEHRRKGVCQAIMRSLTDDFRRRGGGALILGTGFESAAYWIYHSFGFRSLKSGFMRFDAREREFDSAWFADGPVHIAPLEWRHWPLISFLASVRDRDRLRSALWNLWDIANLEGPVVRFLVAQAEGGGANGAVIETGGGAVVGCATLHPTGGGVHGWPGVWLLDHFTHPNFAVHAGDLLAALVWPVGKVISYVDTGMPEKAALLERHGFEREGTLREFLRAEGGVRDVWLYGKTVD